MTLKQYHNYCLQCKNEIKRISQNVFGWKRVRRLGLPNWIIDSKSDVVEIRCQFGLGVLMPKSDFDKMTISIDNVKIFCELK